MFHSARQLGLRNDRFSPQGRSLTDRGASLPRWAKNLGQKSRLRRAADGDAGDNGDGADDGDTNGDDADDGDGTDSDDSDAGDSDDDAGGDKSDDKDSGDSDSNGDSDDRDDGDVVDVGRNDIVIDLADVTIAGFDLSGPGLADEHIDERIYSVGDFEIEFAGIEFTIGDTAYRVCKITIVVEPFDVILEDVTLGDGE